MILAVNAIECLVVEMPVTQIQLHGPMRAFVVKCEQLSTMSQHEPFVSVADPPHFTLETKCLRLPFAQGIDAYDSNFRHEQAYPIF